MLVIIRPARAADQFAITAIVRAAWLNPMGLNWPRFIVATWGEDIIGVGQVKPHGDGSRELASIAVVPEWQGQGVGSQIVRTLLVREAGVLHLVCRAAMTGYYARFGFHQLARDEMPPYFRRIERVMRLAARLTAKDSIGLAVMRREP